MASASDLVTTIISDMGRGNAVSISDTVLIDIVSSIREYEAQRFYFNEQTIALSFTSTNTYALSLFAAAGAGVSDIIEVDGIDITVNGRTYDLDPLGSQDMLRRQGNGYSGNPSFYSIYGQKLLIESTPNQALTATMAAHVKLSEVTISSSNAWTNDAFELIRNATLKRLWGRRYKDYDAAQASQVAESAALSALQRRTEGLAGSQMDSYL